MTANPAIIALLATLAFLLGVAVTLVVCERSIRMREKRQALRERELIEIDRYVDEKLNRFDRLSKKA